MFVRHIRYAALAIAALALATSINVTPAAAASGPDLRVRYEETSFNVNGAHRTSTYFTVRNDGDKKSDTFLAQERCGYLNYGGTVDWVVVDTVPALVGSPIEPQ